MLRFLAVRHLAVIDALEIELEPGLNVLSGETGAGKTVLVEAIDLLVGGRASADLVRTGEETASIQAIFEKPDGREMIVRREVSAQGRSRAFIDDTLARSSALRELGAELVDLHGQHEHQSLLDPATHLDVLDAFAREGDARTDLANRFTAWRDAVAALERTRMGERERRARIEMASLQLQEIEKVAPLPDEDDRLAAERLVLANADRLSRLSAEAFALLYENEDAALTTLAGVWKRVHELASLDIRFASYAAQRDALKAGLEDLAHVLRSYGSELDASPERLQAVEDRLAALERLKRKHGPTLADVLARQDALRRELADLDGGEGRAEALAVREREARDAFHEAARTISGRRQEASRRLAGALTDELAALAMSKCRVDVRVRTLVSADAWTARGIDDVEIFFSPNPGEELRPLARIASGGELSRVMLALRQLSTPDEAGRTLIFDEVDAGIGGGAADAVGARLQQLGLKYQVLCITHLAQIAARADAHFHIAKDVRRGRTVTTVARLDDAGRELEVARMIAGADLTPHVRASARELLDTRRRQESPAAGKRSARSRRGA
jgi:DNA repair protein RecN (Recombination protein N)